MVVLVAVVAIIIVIIIAPVAGVKLVDEFKAIQGLFPACLSAEGVKLPYYALK